MVFRGLRLSGFVLLALFAFSACGLAIYAPHSADTASGSNLILLKVLHFGSLLFAVLAVSCGWTSGILYLLQDRRLRLKRPMPLFQLPTIEWTLAMCRYSLTVSMFFLGVCIFTGFLLNSIVPSVEKRILLFDPLVLGTIFLFSFLLIFSGIFSLRLFRTERKRIVFLTLFSFLFLVLVMLFAVLLNNSHWQEVIK